MQSGIIVCGGCGLEFTMNSTRLNELKDTGDVFRCPNGCKRAFTEGPKDREITRLKNRVVVLEQEVSARNAELRAPFRCPWCPRRYVYAHGLGQHLRRVHTKAQPAQLPAKAGKDARGDMGIN